MESWDDDNFEPDVKPVANTAPTNKWEGEDEEEDIKDSWEDEEEEKVQEEVDKAIPKPKKKPLQEKIAEKVKLQEEREKKRIDIEDENDDMSPEEKLRMQKESDLKLALETTFGDTDTLPTTSTEFDEFASALFKKIQPLTKSSEFPNFAENLVRNVCATLNSLDIKKIKNTLDNLYLEKQKLEKGEKAKKNKGKGKVKLKMDDSNQYSAYAVEDYDEFDDFM